MTTRLIGGRAITVRDGFTPVEVDTQVYQDGIPEGVRPPGVLRPVLDFIGPDGVARPMRVAIYWARCDDCAVPVFPGDEEAHVDWHGRMSVTPALRDRFERLFGKPAP